MGVRPSCLALSRFLRLAAACGALVLPACAGEADPNHKPTFPVKGVVLLEGKPAVGVLLVFHPLDDPDPQTPRSYARSGSDGAYLLSTYKAKDGAPAGRYAVTAILQQGDDGNNLLPLRYGVPETSGLRVEVKEGPNDLAPIQLRRT